MKVTPLMKKYSISEKDAQELATMASTVWNNIAFDVLSGSLSTSIPKDEVVEVVLDADRLKTEVMRGKNEQLKALFSGGYDKERYKLQEQLVAAAFPWSRCGL